MDPECSVGCKDPECSVGSMDPEFSLKSSTSSGINNT
jgi:hypothetical protein